MVGLGGIAAEDLESDARGEGGTTTITTITIVTIVIRNDVGPSSASASNRMIRGGVRGVGGRGRGAHSG